MPDHLLRWEYGIRYDLVQRLSIVGSIAKFYPLNGKPDGWINWAGHGLDEEAGLKWAKKCLLSSGENDMRRTIVRRMIGPVEELE